METLDAKARLVVAQLQERLVLPLPPNFWQTILQLLQTLLPLLGPLCGLTTAQEVAQRLANPRSLDVLRLAMQIRASCADAFILSHARDVARSIVDVAGEATPEELAAILPASH